MKTSVPFQVTRGAELRRAGLSVALLVSLPVCAWAIEWADITPSDSHLVSIMPELASAPVKSARRGEAGSTSTVELVQWHRDESGPPFAELFYAQIEMYAQSIFTDANLPTIDEEVKSTFQRMEPVIGEVGDVENAVGEGQYARFSMRGRECVLFRVFDGWVPPDGELSGSQSANMLGRTRLHGWYCADPHQPLSDGEAHAFMQGAGIRGFAVPERSRVQGSSAYIAGASPSTTPGPSRAPGALAERGAPEASVPTVAPESSGASARRPEPAGPGRRSVAVLSLEKSRASPDIASLGPAILDQVMRRVVATIRAGPDVDLVHQHGNSRLTNPRLDQASETLWSGPMMRREPDAERVVTLLRSEGVDLGVLVSVTIWRTGVADVYNHRTDVYVVDARTGDVHHHANVDRDFDRVDVALREALAACERERRG